MNKQLRITLLTLAGLISSMSAIAETFEIDSYLNLVKTLQGLQDIEDHSSITLKLTNSFTIIDNYIGESMIFTGTLEGNDVLLSLPEDISIFEIFHGVNPINLENLTVEAFIATRDPDPHALSMTTHVLLELDRAAHRAPIECEEIEFESDGSQYSDFEYEAERVLNPRKRTRR